MGRRKKRSEKVQVEIVNSDEVSGLIQLEPSKARVPRRTDRLSPVGDAIPRTVDDASEEAESPERSDEDAADSSTGDDGDSGESADASENERSGELPEWSGDSSDFESVDPDDLTPAETADAGSGSHPEAKPSAVTQAMPPPPLRRTPSGERAAVDPAQETGPQRVAERSGAQTAAPSEVPPKDGPVINQPLALRRLAVSVHAAIRKSNASTVLITSPTQASGKTVLTDILREDIGEVAPHRYAVINARDLELYDVDERPEGVVVIVDGPPVLDGDGLIPIPQAWITRFDASIIVAVSRHTRADQLEATAQYLRDAEIPPIGIVMNDLLCPEPSVRLRLWRRYLKQGTVAKDLMTAIRTRGRSLRRTP